MGEQLVFILQGFGLVLAVLALLWLISAVLGRVFMARSRPTPAVAATPSAAGAEPAPAPQAGPPTAHLVAIAAAVAAVTSGRGRVVRVVAPAHGAVGWVRTGRDQHAHGHRTRVGWRVPSVAPVRSAPSSASHEDAHR